MASRPTGAGARRVPGRQQRLGIQRRWPAPRVRPPRARGRPARHRPRGRRRPRVGQHRGELGLSQPGVQRDGDRAGAEGAEERGGPGEAIGKEKGHPVAGLDAAGPQARPVRSNEGRAARHSSPRPRASPARGARRALPPPRRRGRRPWRWGPPPPSLGIRGRAARAPHPDAPFHQTIADAVELVAARPAWNCHSASRLEKPAR